ncbi:MAG: hypothetical protein SGCHY_001990 [Lobulomycetales sp.]
MDVQPFRNLTPRQRLGISLGFLAFSSAGVWMTYHLEEKYPAPVRDPKMKSHIDLLMEDEEKELTDKSK